MIHDAEWETAKKLREKYFFDPLGIMILISGLSSTKTMSISFFIKALTSLDMPIFKCGQIKELLCESMVVDEAFRQQG